MMQVAAVPVRCLGQDVGPHLHRAHAPLAEGSGAEALDDAVPEVGGHFLGGGVGQREHRRVGGRHAEKGPVGAAKCELPLAVHLGAVEY